MKWKRTASGDSVCFSFFSFFPPSFFSLFLSRSFFLIISCALKRRMSKTVYSAFRDRPGLGGSSPNSNDKPRERQRAIPIRSYLLTRIRERIAFCLFEGRGFGPRNSASCAQPCYILFGLTRIMASRARLPIDGGARIIDQNQRGRVSRPRADIGRHTVAVISASLARFN